MRTKRWMATCVVALLSVAAVLAKDIRVVSIQSLSDALRELREESEK